MFSQFVGDRSNAVAPRTRTRTVRLLAGGLGFAGLAAVATAVLARATGMPLWDLTRDPAAINHARALVGIFSNAGILLWGAAVAVMGFASLLVPERRQRRFLVTAAALTTMLMLDDALLLHERALPEKLGLPEKAVVLGYGLATGGWLVAFARAILATRWIVLTVSLGCFALSVLADNVLAFESRATFVEDALKFAGITLWLVYFADTALEWCRSRQRLSQDPA